MSEKQCVNCPGRTDHTTAECWVRASLPDGYMPIPTAEQLADALENVRCFHDLGAELIAPELLANLLAVTTVKESLSVAPSLPTAGSAVEEVDAVAWRYRHSEQEKWQAGVERKSLWETEPLMTVAQHERIVAALSAQTAPQGLRIVLDGPPGPEAGRFVEVENAAGRSVNAGEWRERADGLWELVLHAAQGGE